MDSVGHDQISMSLNANQTDAAGAVGDAGAVDPANPAGRGREELEKRRALKRTVGTKLYYSPEEASGEVGSRGVVYKIYIIDNYIRGDNNMERERITISSTGGESNTLRIDPNSPLYKLEEEVKEKILKELEDDKKELTSMKNELENLKKDKQVDKKRLAEMKNEEENLEYSIKLRTEGEPIIYGRFRGKPIEATIYKYPVFNEMQGQTYIYTEIETKLKKEKHKIPARNVYNLIEPKKGKFAQTVEDLTERVNNWRRRIKRRIRRIKRKWTNSPEPNSPEPNSPEPNSPEPNSPEPNSPEPNSPEPKTGGKKKVKKTRKSTSKNKGIKQKKKTKRRKLTSKNKGIKQKKKTKRRKSTSKNKRRKKHTNRKK